MNDRSVQTHPEGLLSEKVRVSAPGPKTAGAKPTRNVVLGPCEARAWPVRTCVVRPVLPCVERELLVVRCELPREKRERGQCQDAIYERQGSRVGRCDQRGGGYKEQEDVLYGS